MRIDDIVNKNFSRSFMGYDIEQVDGFLDEIIEALERYESEKARDAQRHGISDEEAERGQQVPLADMKKEIDSGRATPKKTAEEPQRNPQRRAEDGGALHLARRGRGKAGARAEDQPREGGARRKRTDHPRGECGYSAACAG